MAERPQEQERTIVFGNGNLAEFGDCSINFEKSEVTFLFRPSPKMKWKENISDEDYDKTRNWIKKTYQRELCQCVDPSPDFQTWILFCDYYGKPVDLADKINQELLSKNISLKKEVQIWKKMAHLTQLETLKIISFPEERRTKMLEQFKKQSEAIGSSASFPPFTQPSGGR